MSRSSMAADGRGGGVEFRGRVRDRVEGGGVNSRRGNGTINVGGRERGRTFLAGGSERGMSRERVGRWLEGEDLQEKERGGRKDSEGRGEGADGGETDKESQKLVERAREFLVAMTNNTGYEGHDTLLSSIVTVTSATLTPHAIVNFSLTIPEALANGNHKLHGGAYGLIFDCLTTVALSLLMKPGFWQMGGVSRTLNVCYLKAVDVGERVRVRGEVVGVGRRLCYLRGTMMRYETGEVIATCEHNKVNTDPPSDSKL